MLCHYHTYTADGSGGDSECLGVEVLATDTCQSRCNSCWLIMIIIMSRRLFFIIAADKLILISALFPCFFRRRGPFEGRCSISALFGGRLQERNSHVGVSDAHQVVVLERRLLPGTCPQAGCLAQLPLHGAAALVRAPTQVHPNSVLVHLVRHLFAPDGHCDGRQRRRWSWSRDNDAPIVGQGQLPATVQVLVCVHRV